MGLHSVEECQLNEVTTDVSEAIFEVKHGSSLRKLIPSYLHFPMMR